MELSAIGVFPVKSLGGAKLKLVVIDCGGMSDGRFGAFTQSAALRLARGGE